MLNSVRFASRLWILCCITEKSFMAPLDLTHWGLATHICFGKLTIIGSDNGLSPGRRQAIIWTIAGILLIGPLWTNFSEILIGIQTFSFKKMRLKMPSAKWRPFCLGLNVLRSLPVKMAPVVITWYIPAVGMVRDRLDLQKLCEWSMNLCRLFR